MMNKYPKKEKLKKRTLIKYLFENGTIVSNHPLKMIYTEVKMPVEAENILQIGVSVSKRYFKSAVDRNYYKRLLREAYRLNKQILLANVQQPTVCMIFYQTKEKLPFWQVEEKVQKMFSMINNLDTQEQNAEDGV